SEETKRKISDSAIGQKRPPRSQEHRAKLSAALTGKAKSPEHMAALQAGRQKQTYSDARRAKVSASLKAAYARGLAAGQCPARFGRRSRRTWRTEPSRKTRHSKP
ncbi:MAG: hypothetical protein E5W59_12595, partial [Mesorhizobium sp.]